MKLIVGLGNPGRRYAANRHNIGFTCVDFLAKKHAISLSQRKFRSLIGAGEVEGIKVLLAKPRTFMNLSGQAVSALMHYYRIDVPDIVVVYDDLDIPLGRMRIRERGSAGGHNGMKSLIAHLGNQDFARIRVGIAPLEGEDQQRTNVPAYVLGEFNSEEKGVIKKVVPEVASAVECLLTEGIATAMNRYN